MTQLTNAAQEAAAAAVRAEVPGFLTVHSGELEAVAGQRSGPAPLGTVPITALAFRSPAGDLLGMIAILPIHPTILGADNQLVSADLAGAVRQGLIDVPWTMVATGAAGDISTRPHRREQTPTELARLGTLAAAQLMALLENPGSAVDGAGLAGARTLGFGLPARTNEGAPALAGIRSRLAAAQATGDPVAVREAETALQGAELSAVSRPADPRLTVSAIQVGSLRLVAFGAEPYLDLQAQVIAGAPDVSALVGYTHGYLGYLPTKAAYDTDVYEVNISPVAAGAGELAVAEGIRLSSTLASQFRS
ncbi:hypothetical protein [Fodinicola feengrottensis]|uniref:hypothetical protein n=1 Tax=Fodinicola feengrottensis TaxID=435914 RepID=UPI0013D8C348|nr:hypothetical protein [Fodinicola feengrottensis]